MVSSRSDARMSAISEAYNCVLAHTDRNGVLRMLPARLVSLRGDLGWPAKSPDAIICDFFLLGYPKEKVFKHRPHYLEELKDRIRQEITAIPTDMCQNAVENGYIRGSLLEDTILLIWIDSRSTGDSGLGMDTKTPPIPQKHHSERVQSKKPGRACEVSLPPLTPPPNHCQKPKPPGSPWVRNTPGLQRSNTNYHNNYHETERPYRVLNIGATPLMHACQQGDRTRVQRLLKEQRNTIGFRDRTLRSALHYCMDPGTGGAVATAAPELVNAPDAEGHTPLHLAVIAGDSQLVAVLLANGAEVNVKDLEGHSVLHWATVCGEIECVRLVLASGARPSTPDTRGGSPLHYAAQCCGAAATAELAVPKKVGLKVLQTLLDYGADCNAKDADGRQPILWAASAGSVEAVLALARAGGSASAGASDKDGLTALHCAASRGHTGCVEALVNLCGSQPDHVDDNGCSALHYAATLGHADATALLLRLGADPNRQDRKGRTPALCAAAKGQLETLKILAQHGGSLHARTVRGSGVAHEAAASGRVELIKWLAKKRSGTLDIATHDGRTPLHVAALHGHVDTCKVLLDNGARVNAILRTSKGNQMTALDAALYRGHRDCAKLIQMHGGSTAQQIRSQKLAPYYNEFSTKLRVKRNETTSNSDNDSELKRTRRRRHDGSRGSESYYEEHWEKRRTRRRDSPRKSERTGNRSYSEEELRASKETRRSRGRRTRSESARYESGKRKDRVRRKKSRKSKSWRHDYTESSTTSDSLDSSESEADRQSSRHRTVSKKRTRLKRVEKATGDVKLEPDTPSVSDDSLEVVVVKKSIEKKCEKVISGRRSKTPRDQAGVTGKSGRMKSQPKPDSHSKQRRQTSRKTPTDEEKARNEAEEANDEEKLERGKDNGQSGQGTSHDAGSKSDEGVDAEREVKIRSPEQEVGYQIDAADSTSQEAVEQVVVTAMVHKDQASDTPKSTSVDETSRNGESDRMEGGVRVENCRVQASEPNSRSPRPSSGRPGACSRSRMEHILEKADEMQNILIQKAADLKKGIEDWREHVSGDATEADDRNERGPVETEGVAVEEAETSGESKETVGSTGEGGAKEDTSESIVDHGSDDQTRTEHCFSNDSHDSQDKPDDSQDKADESAAAAVDSSLSLIPPNAERKQEVEAEEDRKQDTSSLESTAAPIRQEEAIDGITNRNKTVITSNVEKTARRSRNVKSSSRSSGSKSRASADKVSPGREGSTSPEKSSRSSQGRSSAGKKSLTSRKSDRRTPAKKSPDDAMKRDSVGSVFEDAAPKRVPGKSPVSTDHGSQDDEKDTSLSSSKKLSFEVAEEDDWSSKDVAVDSEGLSASRTEDRSGSWEGGASGFEEPRRKSRSRPSTAKHHGSGRRSSSSGSPGKRGLVDRSDESSPIRGAIVAVIESPEWAEDEEEEAIDNEIREAIGDDAEMDTDFEDNSVGVMRVLPSTSDDETPRTATEAPRGRGNETLPQVAPKPRPRLLRGPSPCREEKRRQQRILQRRDSGGRDSGIEPSPRTSRIPRRTIKCYPNTEKQQSLNMETVTRDVQVSLRRYHLERKIFFQLMELKRLQIRHGRANEHVLIKRQVEAFHKAGASGPTLGVAKYDQPLTFRHFEAFLYEQLRRLQKRPGTPDWCADPKYCTQKTHRCHHATSAYTSLPIYTYLGGVPDRGGTLLPSIDARGRGQMTVEVSHSTGKRVIALPAERLDRNKRYFVTFTVRGDSQDSDKQKSSLEAQRTTKSI